MMYPLAGFERARWEWQESNRLYSPLLGLSREFPAIAMARRRWKTWRQDSVASGQSVRVLHYYVK